MSVFQAKFDAAIQGVVLNIPRGQIMSYGEVSRAAGYPRHARMVSRAMSRSETPLPWHRVVRSDQTLAFPVESEHYEEQKKRLIAEGLAMLNGKVLMSKQSNEDDLDTLIWGPEDI